MFQQSKNTLKYYTCEFSLKLDKTDTQKFKIILLIT